MLSLRQLLSSRGGLISCCHRNSESPLRSSMTERPAASATARSEAGKVAGPLASGSVSAAG